MLAGECPGGVAEHAASPWQRWPHYVRANRVALSRTPPRAAMLTVTPCVFCPDNRQ